MSEPGREWRLYLSDIAKECRNIRNFTDGLDYPAFTENLEKVYATAKAFENIGEAVKKLPEEVTRDYPQIPWKEAARMRDILTHHYFGLDDRVLWDTLGEEFTLFETVIREMIERYGNREETS